MPNQNSMRFTRWSRKGYAIFAGLGKHIIIGVLSVGICMMAMLKSGVVTSDDYEFVVSRVSADDAQDEASPASLQGLLCLVVSADKGEGACAYTCSKIYIEGCSCHGRPFLFNIIRLNNDCPATQFS